MKMRCKLLVVSFVMGISTPLYAQEFTAENRVVVTGVAEGFEVANVVRGRRLRPHHIVGAGECADVYCRGAHAGAGATGTGTVYP